MAPSTSRDQLNYCFVWNQENNIIFSEFNLCNNTVLSRDVEAPSPTARYVISGKNNDPALVLAESALSYLLLLKTMV